jgi:hypothetical protein
MRNHHIFLTSYEDYSLAILLSFLPRSLEKQIKEIEFFYQGLNGKGFYKGTNLQTLTHILAYG